MKAIQIFARSVLVFYIFSHIILIYFSRTLIVMYEITYKYARFTCRKIKIKKVPK